MEKYDTELLDGDQVWGKNYISAEQNLPAVKKQFEDEEKEGLMIRCSRIDAERESGAMICTWRH